MNCVLSCPHCDEVLIKSHGSEMKIRGKVLVVREGEAHTVCRKCDNEVKVPLMVNGEMLKSLTQKKPTHPRLYVPVKKTS